MAENEMAAKIKALRTEQNLTLEQVGKAVGVGKSTVRKWETGAIANMRRDKIAALAKVLKTTPAYLMGWDDSGKSEKTPISPQEDGRTEELVELFGKLAADQQALIIAQIKGILSAQ